MTGPTHIIIALASSVALQQVTNLRLDIFQVLLVLLGSLAPDLDTDGSLSKPGNILYRFVGPGLARLIDAIAGVILGVFHLFVRHRGVTHWPLFCLLLFIIAKVFDQNWLLFFALGYASHLIADFMTVGGIPLFGPFNKKKYSASICSVKSKTEFIIAIAFLIYTLYFGFQFLPKLTQEAYQAGWAKLLSFFQ